MRAGILAAAGEFIILMDADGSMDPADVDLYVEQLALGADLVKGSRNLDGGGSADITWLRDFGNARLRDLANVLFQTNFTELCYGYMGLRRSAITRLALDADGFEIETQIVTRAVRAGLAIAEVPSMEAPRRSGESNLRTFRDGWRVLRTILAERVARGAPMHIPISPSHKVAIPIVGRERVTSGIQEERS
jgi:glycosyltransferase involved in cell wall biosynthesis